MAAHTTALAREGFTVCVLAAFGASSAQGAEASCLKERAKEYRGAVVFRADGRLHGWQLATWLGNASHLANRSFIQDLATCTFISRHENVLPCGPTGVRKSHLANGLAIEALKRDLRVLSRVTHRLLTDLHAARASGSHPRLLAKVLAADLLVLDDFGLHPLSP